MSSLEIPEEILSQYALHPWTWEMWVPQEILNQIPNDPLTKIQISALPYWVMCEDKENATSYSLCSDSPLYSNVFFELMKVQETFADTLSKIPFFEEQCEGESDDTNICEAEPPVFVIISEKKTLIASSIPVQINWSSKKKDAVDLLKFFLPAQPDGNKAA